MFFSNKLFTFESVLYVDLWLYDLVPMLNIVEVNIMAEKKARGSEGEKYAPFFLRFLPLRFENVVEPILIYFSYYNRQIVHSIFLYD